MTIRSFTSANAFVAIDASMFASFISSSSASLISSAFVGLVFSPSTSFLMPVIQNMTKPFCIGKPVKGADNIVALIYTKKTL